MAARRNERFDPNEVEALVQKAKEGDIVARDELLYRFQRLVASLVHVCITGRPNTWSTSQKAFLRMFGGKETPLLNIAQMLKKELENFEKEELFTTGQLAILQAIPRSNKNLVATIVICFKDEIYSMIKGSKSSASEFHENELFEPPPDDEIALNLFLESLPEDEWIYAQRVLDGEKNMEDAPKALRKRFVEYLGYDPSASI